MKKLILFLVLFSVFKNNVVFGAQNDNRAINDPCFKVGCAALLTSGILAISGMVAYHGKPKDDIEIVWLWSTVGSVFSSGLCFAATAIKNCRNRERVAIEMRQILNHYI